MKKLAALFSASVAALLPYFVGAASIAVPGGTVEYTGATSVTTLPNGEVVIVYANADVEGTLTVPAGKDLRTRIFAVGGGGAGGSIAVNSKDGVGGGGGGAGGVSDHFRDLTNGTYTVYVGRGGQKVESESRSWTGDDGRISSVEIGNENVAAAVGGGGGGSNKLSGNGTKGGCGGGGSWYHGVVLRGGSGTDGQGWAGGTPTNEVTMCGGGGGGAATDPYLGRGGADGAPGAGYVCDITGSEVTYAAGGRGGNPADPSYVPADGDFYGDGGDGAVLGKGGAGADGVVIIRIVKSFEYKYIEFPTYLSGIVFTNNTTATAFDYDSWEGREGATLSGTNSVDCCFSGPNNSVTNGLGRHSFTLTLKDEYLWDFGNGNYSDSPFTAYWRVLEPGTVGQADVKISKNVDWSEGGRARIAIEVSLVPEIKEKVPNVLFLSGLCDAHGYSADVAKAAIDAMAQVANVDYYFFDNVTSTSATAPKFSGHVDKGGTFDKNILTMATNNHSPLYGFYNTLAQVIDSGVTYDYVAFSFDRSKVATSFPGQHSREADVANFLKPFYENDSVIWLVDHEPADWTTDDSGGVSKGTVIVQQTPWVPNQLVYLSATYNDTDIGGWTTLQGYWRSTGASSLSASSSARVAYRALIGIFSPQDYPGLNSNVSGYSEPTLTQKYSGVNAYYVQNNTDTKTKVLDSQGHENDNQCLYDDANAVGNLIRQVVVAKSFTGNVNDNVCVNMGLDVVGANALWTTNEETMGWVVAGPNELQVTDEGVKVAISNLVTEAWIKLYIDVEDTGSFLNSEEGAKYNERTGKWEKDPNDGPVVVSLTPDGQDSLLAQAEASTSVLWAYDAHKVTAELVHGEGTWSINGFLEKPMISVGAGYSPEVVFRGDTGWVLDYLEVDGVVIEDFDPSTTHWVFEKISGDHNIKFGFEKASFKLLRAVQRYPWNNLVDIDYYINAEGMQDSCMVGRLVFFVEYESDDGASTVRRQLKTFRDNDIMFHNWYSADPEHHWNPYWTSLQDAAHWPFAQDETIKLGGKNHYKYNRTGYHRITWDSNKDGVAIFQKKKVSYYMYVCEGDDSEED